MLTWWQVIPTGVIYPQCSYVKSRKIPGHDYIRVLSRSRIFDQVPEGTAQVPSGLI